MRQEVEFVPKSRGESGEKNLIADKLRQLRESHGFSQRKLAMEFQLMGLDIDRNVITRIETKQRYVTDIELCAIMKVFQISSEELLGGWENKIQFVHTPEDEEQERVQKPAESRKKDDEKRKTGKTETGTDEKVRRVFLKNFPSEEDLREAERNLDETKLP